VRARIAADADRRLDGAAAKIGALTDRNKSLEDALDAASATTRRLKREVRSEAKPLTAAAGRTCGGERAPRRRGARRGGCRCGCCGGAPRGGGAAGGGGGSFVFNFVL
jgi:hypothetical protein